MAFIFYKRFLKNFGTAVHWLSRRNWKVRCRL